MMKRTTAATVIRTPPAPERSGQGSHKPPVEGSIPSGGTRPCRILLDSGAYTAYTQKTSINLQDYIDYIKEHEEEIEVYVNLDVIGDSKASWKNQKEMERQGLNPLPVYHIMGGESVEYLYRCLDNYPYFCIGTTMAGAGGKMDTRWPFTDRCFSIICDTPKHLPRAKIHGLGMMTPKLIWRYPWYSIDASTWKLQTGYGRIFSPCRRDRKTGHWVYNDKHEIVAVSARSTIKAFEVYRQCASQGKTHIRDSGLNLGRGDHWENLPWARRQNIMDYIQDKGHVMGESSFHIVAPDYELDRREAFAYPSTRFTSRETRGQQPRVIERVESPGISNSYYHRLRLNIDFFVELESALPKWPWAFTEGFSKRSLGLI